MSGRKELPGQRASAGGGETVMGRRTIPRRDFVVGSATAPLVLGALGCSAGDDSGQGQGAAPVDPAPRALEGAVVVGPVPLASPIRGLQAERMRLAAERRAGIPARVASWGEELEHVRSQVRAAKAAGVDAFMVPVVAGEHEPAVSENLRRFHEAVAALRDEVAAVLDLDGLASAVATGRVGLIPWFQGAKMIEADLALFAAYRASGAGIMAPTHLWKMPYGDGAFERSDQGLTATGRLAIAAMNRERIVIDLSGMGPRSSLDAMDESEQPVVFSHSNVRAIHDHPMNVGDEHLRACADLGGVVGVSAFPACVSASDRPTPDDVLRHLDHIAEVAGIDHVALGLDFTDLPRKRFPSDPVPDPPYRFPDGFSGFEDLPRLRDRLAERGYGEDDRGKILGGNMVRVLRRVWGSGAG